MKAVHGQAVVDPDISMKNGARRCIAGASAIRRMIAATMQRGRRIDVPAVGSMQSLLAARGNPRRHGEGAKCPAFAV